MKIWTNAGVGINNSSILAVGGNINFKTFSFYSQIGYQKISRLISGDIGNVKGELMLSAVNFGAGLLLQKKYYFGAVFIGPAIVFGEKRGNEIIEDNVKYRLYNKSNFVNLGITLNSQLFLKIFKRTALGLELYGTVNGERTMAEIKTSISICIDNM